MARISVILESNISDSFRVQQILGMFDLPEQCASRVELAVELPQPEESWRIGAIVGPSGSGKSSVSRAAFGPDLSPPPRWPRDCAVIDAFEQAPLRQTLALLAAVGFNSPPAWLRPYHVLSAGEQFRCDLARRLSGRSKLLVIDEFTSHLDRDTARSCSYALGRHLRRNPCAVVNHQGSQSVNQDVNQAVNQVVNHRSPESRRESDVSNCVEMGCGALAHAVEVNQKVNHLGAESDCESDVSTCAEMGCSDAVHPAQVNQKPTQNVNHTSGRPIQLVAVTGHEDILPWLAPDWILRMSAGTLDRGPLSTPSLPLRFGRANRSMWADFRPHHYLTGQLARGATCYVARWDDRPAAFCAVLGQIGHPGRKRITRLVTLPQFQGLGIGMRLAEHVCRLEQERGFRVSIATSHPAVIDVCRRSPRWRYLGIKRCGGTPQCIRGRRLAGSTGRIVAAFEFNAECGIDK